MAVPVFANLFSASCALRSDKPCRFSTRATSTGWGKVAVSINTSSMGVSKRLWRAPRIASRRSSAAFKDDVVDISLFQDFSSDRVQT